MGVRIKDITGVHWKTRFLGGEGVTKKLYIGGIVQKGGLGQFADLVWGLAKNP